MFDTLERFPDTTFHGASEAAMSRSGEIDDLEEEMANLAGVVNAAQGRIVELVADALERELWAQADMHTPVHWLCWKLGCSTTHARRLVKLAGRRSELPETVEAMSRGELSLDQASVIARHVPATHSKAATELAREATVSQLLKTLPKYGYEDTPTYATTRPVERHVERWTGDNGGWNLRAELPRDEGAIIERALAAAHHDLFHAARSDNDDDATVTMADALVAVAENSLEAGEARLPGTDRFCVLAHLEADPTDASAAPTMGLHLEDAPLPDALRRLISCDTDMRPVWERHGTPVSVGRRQRIVPDRTRRLVEHRDGQCAVPGCERRRHLQIHHIEHWEDGGPTDTSNLVALCRHHHRVHHEGKLGITGDADDALTFTDARGRPLEHAPHPRPPDRLPPAPRYRHPSGELFDPTDVYLSPN